MSNYFFFFFPPLLLTNFRFMLLHAVHGPGPSRYSTAKVIYLFLLMEHFCLYKMTIKTKMILRYSFGKDEGKCNGLICEREKIGLS